VSQTTVPNPTRVDEIADGIFRLATAVDLPDGPGAFSFNQYLIDDDEPLLFHTGPRKLFPLVRQGVEKIMPLARLRYVGFSHFEADECGALNDFLAARRAPSRSAAESRPWSRSTIMPTGHPVRSRTEPRSSSGGMSCAGATRRICRMAGNAGS